MDPTIEPQECPHAIIVLPPEDTPEYEALVDQIASGAPWGFHPIRRRQITREVLTALVATHRWVES